MCLVGSEVAIGVIEIPQHLCCSEVKSCPLLALTIMLTACAGLPYHGTHLETLAKISQTPVSMYQGAVRYKRDTQKPKPGDGWFPGMCDENRVKLDLAPRAYVGKKTGTLVSETDLVPGQRINPQWTCPTWGI